MALGRFVFEGRNQHASEKLPEFLDFLAEIAAEDSKGVIALREISSRYSRNHATDTIITDAQWCRIDRSAISLCVEGSREGMLSGIADLASSIHRDISIFYSVTEFENRIAVTNDTHSRYYDSRLAMLISVNPKLAGVGSSLYGVLQDVVGGAYRFNDESSMRQFVFETFGFRPDSREQIAEIVELYSYQMLLDSGLKLSVDEALTNTEFVEFLISDENEAIVV